MKDPSVTTVIYQRVDKARLEEYREWQQRITAACGKFEGYLDTQLFEPGVVTHNDSEFVIVFRFRSEEFLRKWMDSDTRAALVEEAEEFNIGKTKIAFFSGLEHWFSQGAGPPRYKMTLVTFFAIWPLVHFLPPQVDRLLDLNPLANELLSTALMTVLMSYIALPLACRVFRFWLKT
jgi:antibiotic biosynthesis monooxygenase (ABM) superfamily enzyme